MALGTFFRILLAIVIIICPFVSVYFTNDNDLWALLTSYLFLPFLIMWENSCDCKDCILSNYCEAETRFKFVKKVFSFIGFDEQKLNNIKYSNNCENTYSSMINYIKHKYYDK